MNAENKYPVPQSAEAYISELALLMRDVSLLPFKLNQVLWQLQEIDKNLQFSSSELRNSIYTEDAKEGWFYELVIRNVQPTMIDVLQNHEDEYGFLPYRIVPTLDHLARTRSEALEIGQMLSGHFVHPRNKDLIRPVFLKKAFRGFDEDGEGVDENRPDNFQHFSTKPMKLKQSWDREYTPRNPQKEIRIDPYAVSRDGQPCCRTQLIIRGSYAIKKWGIRCLDDLKHIDMHALWSEHLKLLEVDDAALLRHVQRKNNQRSYDPRRLAGRLKRISTLELGGEHYLSTHNLCVEAGMRASSCRPINANLYLPAH